jgi:hypothetical protein
MEMNIHSRLAAFVMIICAWLMMGFGACYTYEQVTGQPEDATTLAINFLFPPLAMIADGCLYLEHHIKPLPKDYRVFPKSTRAATP